MSSSVFRAVETMYSIGETEMIEGINEGESMAISIFYILHQPLFFVDRYMLAALLIEVAWYAAC